MTSVDIDRILRECALLTSSADEPELRALRNAILIEDTFDVILTDEQLGIDFLEDPAALRELLAKTSSHA